MTSTDSLVSSSATAVHSSSATAQASINNIMLKRKTELLRLEKEINNNLQDAPEGSLRISQSRGRTQYYLRKKPTDKGGAFIRKDRKELAARLAQKDYDQKLLKQLVWK